MVRLHSVAFMSVSLAAAAQLAAQSGQSARVVTTRAGTFLLDRSAPWSHPAPLGGIDSILWTELEPISIPESCGLSPGANAAWVGEQLNNERLQLFAINGSGTPTFEVPGNHNIYNPAAVAAAANADLAVFLDYTSATGPFVLSAFRSGSATPIWTYPVAANINSSGTHNLKVSRDGSTVLLLVGDSTTLIPSLITLDGATGQVRSTWNGANGLCYGVDCTDNGSQAIICQGDPPAGSARLIDTATGTQITTFPANGAGGWYNISGDGSVIVIGGFDLKVFVRSGSTYPMAFSFYAPSSWFSWGSAVSRDGTTVAALAHDYASGYLIDTARIWDVASHQLLASVTTNGSGAYQDSIVYGVLSDDGSRFACASWGDQFISHPQVRVFDRSLNLLGSITTLGSPFCLDMTGDGQYILTGFKSVHANVMGNGGGVTLLQIPVASICYPNCDGSTTPPVLNIADFTCFLNRFAAGDSYANCDGSTTPPVLNISDFTCFLNRFAAGCS